MNDAEKIEKIRTILVQYANMPGGDNFQEGVMAILTVATIGGIVYDS